MALPVPVHELPRELQAAVDDALVSQYWPGGVRAVEDYISTSGERSGAVLATWAWFLFQDCTTARADAAEQLIPDVLRLLDEAVGAGLPRDRISGLRDRASQFLGQEEAATSKVLWSLRADPDEIHLPNLWKLAHLLADPVRDRPVQAAERFEILARRHEERGEQARADEARDHAGLCWARSGAWDRARPLLMATAMRRDPDADRRANLAWGWLVRRCVQTDDPDLEMRFEAAVAWGRSSAAGHWPADATTQDELLAVFVSREARRPLAHLVHVLQTRRPPGTRPPELEQLLHRARRVLRPLG
jgi:hypothetical protein